MKEKSFAAIAFQRIKKYNRLFLIAHKVLRFLA